MVDFTRDSIIEAINVIEQNPEIRKGRQSIEYDLVYEGRPYPPILVLSEASKILGGREVLLNDFNNSTRVPFEILGDLGFKVVKREANFYDELIKFLQQASTTDLKTSHFVDTFRGLKVKVSFGQGSQARVPWIAFLGGNNSVSDGIYPVYLFFKSKSLLILAYGLSETNTPKTKWNLTNPTTIANYFLNNRLGQPDRYGDSYVFAAYDTSKSMDKKIVNSDINRLAEVYKDTLNLPYSNETLHNQTVTRAEAKPTTVVFSYDSFHKNLTDSGLFFEKSLCLRFVGSLIAKPFVILTGLSGSGKTKLAHSLAIWLTEKESQYCVVPVGADWTNREPLLGFPNALKQDEYVKPDNKILDIIITAGQDPKRPYFIILDEMNLSHVERYFADFLSVMESKNKIFLHNSNNSDVPSELDFPENLFIIGTVNIDETTYMFSPKVLDRASVIEFRITELELGDYIDNHTIVNMDVLKGAGKSMAENFVAIATNKSFVPHDPDELRDVLLQFFVELKKVGAEFGFRTASEIIRFAGVINQIEPKVEMSEILDAAIMQKLLPKVHGSRRKLEPVLKTLGNLCLQNGKQFNDYSAPESRTDVDIKYPISFEKIIRMHENLLSNGFTSYAEA
jgi:5-methylcytosine-specific restriction enzyme B